VQPFFQVDVELSIPSVTMNPSLDDVQSAINQCAMQIIGSTRHIAAWNPTAQVFNDMDPIASSVRKEAAQSAVQPSAGRSSIYSRVANDIEMVKNVLILTGAVQTLRSRVRTMHSLKPLSTM
jgi:dynein heavy chain